MAGDPGGQQVVGVLGEVLAHEDVEEVGVALQVGVRQYDELPLANADGDLGGAAEVVGVAGEHRCGDEDGGRVRGPGPGEHLGDGVGVATDEAVEEAGLVNWHTTTVAPGADDALTAG
jgi:hypothetical protein